MLVGGEGGWGQCMCVCVCVYPTWTVLGVGLSRNCSVSWKRAMNSGRSSGREVMAVELRRLVVNITRASSDTSSPDASSSSCKACRHYVIE